MRTKISAHLNISAIGMCQSNMYMCMYMSMLCCSHIAFCSYL